MAVEGPILPVAAALHEPKDYNPADQDALLNDWEVLPTSSEMLMNEFAFFPGVNHSQEVWINYILDSLKRADLSELKTSEQVATFINNHIEKCNDEYFGIAAPRRTLTKEQKETIEKAVSAVMSIRSPSKVGKCANVLLAVTTALALAYWGGPISSTAARAIFTKIYGSIYGVPALYNPSYWLTFMPLREHVAALAYKFGPNIMTMVGAPAAYNTTSAVKSAGGAVARLGGKLLGSENTAHMPYPTVWDMEQASKAKIFSPINVMEDYLPQQKPQAEMEVAAPKERVAPK